MSKRITKTEYIDNIRNIINEGMSDVEDYIGSDRFVISRYIAGLLEEGHRNPKLMDFLLKWDRIVKENIAEGEEYLVYRQFAEELMPFATGDPAVKMISQEISNTIADYADQLDIFVAIHDLHDIVAQETVYDMYNEYLYEPTEDNRKNVIEALWPAYDAQDPAAIRIMTLFADASAANHTVDTYLVEQENVYDNINKRLAKQREEKKVKRIQERLEAYANEIFENAKQKKEQEKEYYSLNGLANNNNIGLREAIKSIVASDARKNKKLMETIEQYAGALNAGLYEERLYETFLHNMSAYTYLNPVEKAIKTVNENVKKNTIGIEITKLLEEMAESQSFQILPLIEEDCARYAKEPTPNNRVQVRNCLMQFATDPYCYKILETIDRDNSREANTITEQTVSFKDTVRLIREKAETTPLYSPVQYIKEGECVFYTNGTYYVKKNNTISKLPAENIQQLSEKFVTLCKLINDPNVTLTENCIFLQGSDKVAKIYEGYVEINGVKESQSSLRNLQEMCMKYDFDTNFFIMCSCLHENFNNIAKLNFGTHIALKEDNGINVDMFRLGDNIFINTINESLQQSTFYQNVNPLQCKNIINGHMGLNVSVMFENLLPAQDKILMRLNETQNEYMNSINSLEAAIEKAEEDKKKCKDESKRKKCEDAIEAAKEKLNDIKAEYKEWQKKVEAETGEDMGADESDDDDTDEVEVNGDGDTRKETTSEPLDDDEVEDNMEELSTPISADTAETDVATEEGEAFNLTDDEFDSFLNADDSDDVELDTTEDDNTDEETSDSDMDFNDEVSDTVDDVVDDIELDTADDTAEDSSAEPNSDAILSIEGETADDTDMEFPESTEVEHDEEAFTELNVDDDDIEIETPAEEIPNDEDVIMDIDPEEATDEFGGDINDPLNDTKTVDTEDMNDTAADKLDNMSIESNITKVMFDENIKTGEKYRSGTVCVVTPMISQTGELYNKNVDYKFYLNDEGNPVIDGDDMSAQLYKAICQRITAEPNYDIFVKEGVDKINKEKSVESDIAPVKVMDNDDIEFDTEDEDNVDDSYFKVTDLPDEFTVEPDFDDSFDDTEDDITIDDSESDIPFIPTYKSGETEIELPAPSVDDTEIPESKSVKTSQKHMNENRKSIKGINSVLKTKNGTRFFVNEGTVKSSKSMNRTGSTLIREKVDGADRYNKGSLIEYYSPETDTNNMNKIRYYAVALTNEATATGYSFKISDIASYLPENEELLTLYNPYYFIIESLNNPNESYVIYQVENKIYYRLLTEFNDIIKDFEDEIPAQLVESLKYEYYNEQPLIPIALNDKEMQFVIKAIISSICGESLMESCTIRRSKLSAGHDYLNSKLADDIQHGDEEERKFKEEIEADTQASGIENPLAPSAPAQEEAYEPVLPNAHRKQVISEMLENYDIIYEANDQVLYHNKSVKIINVSEDNLSAVILTEDGKKIKVETKDLEPDPDYINDLNASDNADINDLNAKNHDKEKDLDMCTVSCNIVNDGHKINLHECYAFLKDIIESKKMIRVINEDIISEYDIDDNVEFTELPYAVVVNAEGEPIRKIQIYPQSYVNAGDQDMVKCICGGKETQFPKHCINILS